MRVEIDGLTASRDMKTREVSWFELTASDARPGDRYRFVLEDGSKIPDPASRYQPDDMYGASEVIDPFAYQWQVTAWLGRPWEEAVVYELHLGRFTAEGTYRAAVGKLDNLVALGITAIQIAPVAVFPGLRSRDCGVSLYAPDSSYGRPEEFKSLIDAAHARGLMVLLDVAYNYFGPDSSYPAKLASRMITRSDPTLWSSAIDQDAVDSAVVREFIIHNALYWIEEFNIDGLRLNAVPAIADDGGEFLLDELTQRVRASTPGRWVHLLLESR